MRLRVYAGYDGEVEALHGWGQWGYAVCMRACVGRGFEAGCVGRQSVSDVPSQYAPIDEGFCYWVIHVVVTFQVGR